MLHTKFHGNRPACSGEGFYHNYMDVSTILVMWPESCHQIFISLYLKVFIQNLVLIGTVVSEKILFEFLYVHDLGPRSRNHIDLQYSYTINVSS